VIAVNFFQKFWNSTMGIAMMENADIRRIVNVGN
jgi:hypothetical protein